MKKFESGEEEEEDKEQCSPVSVLDPPFEDDDEGHGNGDEEEEEEGGFDMECSYAIVQSMLLSHTAYYLFLYHFFCLLLCGRFPPTHHRTRFFKVACLLQNHNTTRGGANC